jgi:uncharacterized protein (TIGR03435 family)
MIPLANHLLESTAFAIVAALVTLAFRNNRARARHALWMVASVKFLVPFSALIWAGSQLSVRSAAPAPEPQLTIVMSVAPPVARPQAIAAQAPGQQRSDWLPPALWTLYLSGCAAIVLRWRRRWTRIARAANRAHPKGAADGVKILASAEFSEPGVFGIFRPALLMPAGIDQRLSPEQLEAVIAHELAHVRRRDNLAASVHMAVEALFWFHPMVWWIGARMVEERELACDEEVVHGGIDRATYASGILEVCQLSMEAPLTCVSGITGADLKARIAGIMTTRAPESIRAGKRALLSALAVSALAVPLVIGIAHPTRGQAQPRTAPAMAFDAVSVKPSGRTWLQVAPQRAGGLIHWQTDLTYLIDYAYHIANWRLSGPVPGSDYIFEVEARTKPEATEDEVRLMFQSMLAERFHLEAHRATKEVDGWALTVAKNGPKFKAAKDDDPPPPMPEWFTQGAKPGDVEGKVAATLQSGKAAGITGRRVTMGQLAGAVQQVLHNLVVDETGLPGKYYFAFQFAPENAPADAEEPPLLHAIQESLGLKLEKRRAPVEMLVVDRIDKTPTEN